MATVSQRRSPRTGVVTYRVRFRVGGVQREEGFEDAIGAHEFCDLVNEFGAPAAVAILERRRDKGEDTPTLRQFTARYLAAESGLLTGITEGTRSGYLRTAELSFLRVLGELPIDAIERQDVGRWVAWQEKQPSKRRPGQPVSAKTVANYHALLSNVLKAAMDAKLRVDNPAYKMRLTRGQKTRDAVFLSPAEFRTLLYFIPTYHKRLVLLLAGTGLRWGEATALTWRDLQLWASLPTLRVDKAWKKGPKGAMVLGPPKSKKANRTVSMHAGLVAALGTPEDGDLLIFRGPQSGNRLWYPRFSATTWNPAVEKALDKTLCASLGLTPLTRRPTPHDLRHTHASWLIAAGMPLPYVQARLGHEKITTTVDVYGHLVPEAHDMMATAIADTLSTVNDPATPALTMGDEGDADYVYELTSDDEDAYDDDVTDADIVFDGEVDA